MLDADRLDKVHALVREQLDKVEPVFVYFMTKVFVEQADVVAIFGACRLFDPVRIDALGGDVNEVDAQLQRLPFISQGERAQMIAQLAVYRASAIGDALTADCDREAWWANREQTPGTIAWFNGATKAMLLQPSAGSCERLFSMLKALMNDHQAARANQDYQQATIMTRYNQIQRGEA